MRNSQSTVYRERALLVKMLDSSSNGNGPHHLRPHEMPDSLHELESLAKTAGADIVDYIVQRRERPDPKTFLGKGKIHEIGQHIGEHKADVVIFDHNLSPAQTRNLENELKRKVIDRTELILDIFATHARTNQARLQVELAQLEYNLPRLKRMWTHLDTQAGGTAGGLGGIGTRGPGEKQIEVDRRIARKRISDLKKEIRRREERKQREVSARSTENYTVSLVGYTNAGKSTLMNRLTKAGVGVDNKLFSTLDTRTRLWQLRTGLKTFLSDTVGFIKNLPHDLVASFHATLEEVMQADLLLHVIDASHPEMLERMKSVEDVLKQMKCDDKDTILVFNKIDSLRDNVERTILANKYPQAVQVSADCGEGVEILTSRVERSINDRLDEMEVRIPVTEGKLLSSIGASCVVLQKSVEDEFIYLKLRVPKRQSWMFAPFRLNTTYPHP